MKATIEVSDRKEAEQIRTGLADPTVRAFVVVMGALNSLPSERAKARVLNYVMDYFKDRDDAPARTAA
jgi:hypothetical protein